MPSSEALRLFTFPRGKTTLLGSAWVPDFLMKLREVFEGFGYFLGAHLHLLCQPPEFTASVLRRVALHKQQPTAPWTTMLRSEVSVCFWAV